MPGPDTSRCTRRQTPSSSNTYVSSAFDSCFINVLVPNLLGVVSQGLTRWNQNALTQLFNPAPTHPPPAPERATLLYTSIQRVGIHPRLLHAQILCNVTKKTKQMPLPVPWKPMRDTSLSGTRGSTTTALSFAREASVLRNQPSCCGLATSRGGKHSQEVCLPNNCNGNQTSKDSVCVYESERCQWVVLTNRTRILSAAMHRGA